MEIAFSSKLSLLFTLVVWSLIAVAVYFVPGSIRTHIPPNYLGTVVLGVLVLVLFWLFFGQRVNMFGLYTFKGHQGISNLLMGTHFQCDSSLPVYLVSDKTSLYCAHIQGFTTGILMCFFFWFVALFVEYVRICLNVKGPSWTGYFTGMTQTEKDVAEGQREEYAKDTQKFCMYAFPVIMILSLLFSYIRDLNKRSRHNYLLTELQRIGLSKDEALKTLIDKEDFKQRD